MRLWIVHWSDKWYVDYGVDSVWTTQEAAEKRLPEAAKRYKDGSSSLQEIETDLVFFE